MSKNDPRIHAIGSVDELNSAVGVLRTEITPDSEHAALLGQLQQELFDIGAHLATVGATAVPDHAWLDSAVADINEALPPLTEFVIPGGTRAAAQAHVCRTVCRRAERDSWNVQEAAAVSRYLNRLSDLLFVMARALNDGQEPQWRGIST